ncbi:GntR family transcriptional regulator [Pseudoclavibacter sp. CFCC 11306]|uniref:GntR family transcriptional regulator n=1 Tax=Pseudoclavibacter sp. CFCC 11306 TaxID=1564493 RepID=UPI00130146EA|nr:GntR family transcriptional regulator [Pseudoclavibacter sp. CFCC 11306]KAB1658894.1 GntR family transcriptional regulator [Pseudoclavibacter sp. CFCC 11306]
MPSPDSTHDDLASAAERETFAPVTSVRAVNALRTAILDGQFIPGERLTQERLADFIGSSRVPVREALKTLSTEGLITLVEHTGAWVTALSREECTEVYRVRERIEPLLLEASMLHLTDEDVHMLDDMRRDIDAEPDLNQVVIKDRAFHFMTYSRGGGTFLRETVQRLWNTTQFYRRRFIEQQSNPGRDMISHEHTLLLDAIRRRDVHSASQLLELHIRRTRLALQVADDIFEA